MLIWGVVLAVHLLAVAAWIGGMFYIVAVLNPSLPQADDQALLNLLMPMFRRFIKLVWHAMPLVLISGYLMLFGFYGGFTEVGWSIHCMHLLGLIMAAVFVLMARGPWQALQNFPDPVYAVGIRRMMIINLVLGGLTILIASLGHFG